MKPLFVHGPCNVTLQNNYKRPKLEIYFIVKIIQIPFRHMKQKARSATNILQNRTVKVKHSCVYSVYVT